MMLDMVITNLIRNKNIDGSSDLNLFKGCCLKRNWMNWSGM